MFMPFFLVTALSFLLCVSLTPLVRILALRWNLVDRPDNQRKVHKLPIPRVGGVAVAAAYFGSLAVMGVYLDMHHIVVSTGLTALTAIVPPAVLIFMLGLADDILDLKPKHKFGAQIVAASLAVFAGVHIPGIHIFGLGAGVTSVLTCFVSVIWLVLCTNAINLIDGLDGLAGGISLLATLTILVASLATGNTGLALATAPLATALLGFLVFNFNPASIFLGDSGSLLLGFLLGCYSILWSGSATSDLQLIVPVLVLAVPVLDVTLAISRRFLRNQPIFKADRSHIHHRLLAIGFGHRKTVVVLYLAAATAGTLSLLLMWTSNLWSLAVLAAFAGAAAWAIQQLGYVEFDALRTVMFRGVRNEISAHLAVQNFEAGLETAQTADAAWSLIQQRCEEFGVCATFMQLDGHSFANGERRTAERAWDLRIPLTHNDWLEISQGFGPVKHPSALVPFITTVRRVLADKYRVSHSQETAFPAGLYTQLISSTH